MNQTLPAMTSLQFRFLPNVTYNLDTAFLNGTIYSSRTINLTDSSHIVSFGHRTTSETVDSDYPKNVYMGLFNYDGIGLLHESFKLYINNTRRDFGFNTIEGDINIIHVMDYFNSTLFLRTVNMSGLTEYNIQVAIFTVFIINSYTNQSIQVELERTNYGETIIFLLHPQSGVSINLLPSVEYELTAFYLTGLGDRDKIESVVVDLSADDDYTTIEFGFYSAPIADIPPAMALEFRYLIAIGIGILILATIIAVVSIYYMRKDKTPQRVKDKYNKTPRKTGY